MVEQNSGLLFKTSRLEKEYMAAYEAVLSLWPVPPEPLDIETHFGTTRINACGSIDNPPMVLIPGFGANSTMWFPNVAALSTKYRLYALDTPGQPGKSVPTQKLLATNSSAWIQEVLDGLGLKKVHLVGISLGGWLALHFAIQAPERTDQVVTLDPAASFAKMSPAFLRHSFWPIMVYPTRPGLIRYFRWMTQGYLVNPRWGELMLLGILNARPQPPLRPVVFTDEDLRGVTVPVLLLIGERSVIYDPKKVLLRALQLIPDIQAEIIPNASHALNSEKSEAVNSRILHFCE